MRLAAYLTRSRHGMFYFRWPIPARLHPDRKRSHVRLSLRTRCPAKARRLSRALGLTGQSLIEAASAQGMKYTEIRQHVADHFQEKLRQFEDWIDTNGPPDAARRESIRNARSFAEMPWSDWSDLMGHEQAENEVRAFCAAREIDMGSLSDDARRWLQDDLRRGQYAYWTEALARIDKLDSFENEMRSTAKPASGLAVSTVSPAANSQAHLSYQEVVNLYFTEVARSGGVAVKTDADKRAALNLLAEITGDKPVAAITKADAQRAKQVLMQYPRDRHKNRSTKGKPLSEVLDLPDRPKIAAKTMNGYL